MLTEGLTSVDRIVNLAAQQSGSVVGIQTFSVANVNATQCPNSADSTTYASGGVIKSAPGIFYGLVGYNSSASAQFIQIYNTATVPANGSVPNVILYASATSSFSISFAPFGKSFSTGICWSNSASGSTKVAGSADCWINAQYI